MSGFSELSKAEKIAVVTSAAIIVAGVIYWGVQVGNVIELLQMAYG